MKFEPPITTWIPQGQPYRIGSNMAGRLYKVVRKSYGFPAEHGYAYVSWKTKARCFYHKKGSYGLEKWIFESFKNIPRDMPFYLIFSIEDEGKVLCMDYHKFSLECEYVHESDAEFGEQWHVKEWKWTDYKATPHTAGVQTKFDGFW